MGRTFGLQSSFEDCFFEQIEKMIPSQPEVTRKVRRMRSRRRRVGRQVDRNRALLSTTCSREGQDNF